MKLKYCLYLLVFMGLNYSCKNLDEPNSSKSNWNEVGFSMALLNLNITATFSDCGEWGGHKERIYVNHLDSDPFIYYEKYPFNCDSIRYYYSKKNLTPIERKQTYINSAKKYEIELYIKKLLNSKFTATMPGNVCNSFTVNNIDSSLFISVCDSRDSSVINFKQLVHGLFK